jgi:transposase
MKINNGYKNEDWALHYRTCCCPVCGETHRRDINASINLYFVGLGRHEEMQALVDDRSPNGLPKKPSCDEAGSSITKG